MTCIVALTDGKKVYMGGDSAAVEVDSNFVSSRIEPKVFVTGDYIIGYSGSFRFGKVVEYSCELPRPEYRDIHKFMNTKFVNAIREAVEENKLDNSEDKDAAELLIGLHGHIFELNSDWHVGEDSNSYNAIGSGSSFALGSLFSTRRIKDPYARIKMALNASEAYSPYVRSPFTILEN
jgi:ATP-dependent protease HslVU (ClpYQ) peptidase subunit